MIENKCPSHTVMDVRIHAVTMEEALRCAREMAASGEEHIIATANAEMVMIAQEDKELAYVLNHCSLVVPDGAGILWAGEQLGTYFPARVAGADYAEEILKIAVKEKWPVYFLGGAPGVAETAIRRFTERYGSFEKAGFHDGYFDEMEEQKKIVRRILNEGIPNEMQLSFSEIIEAGAKNRDCEEYKKACRKFQKITAIYAMFFKNSAFREEQEYRFIFKKKGTGLYREKDGFLIPYVQIQLTDKLLPIKEIVVAPKNHIDLAKKGMEYMIAEKGYDAQVSLSNINLRY